MRRYRKVCYTSTSIASVNIYNFNLNPICRKGNSPPPTAKVLTISPGFFKNWRKRIIFQSSCWMSFVTLILQVLLRRKSGKIYGIRRRYLRLFEKALFPIWVDSRQYGVVFHLRQGFGGQGKRVMVFRRCHRLWRDKLGKWERTDPAKGFSLFPKSANQPLSGTEFLKNIIVYFCTLERDGSFWEINHISA